VTGAGDACDGVIGALGVTAVLDGAGAGFTAGDGLTTDGVVTDGVTEGAAEGVADGVTTAAVLGEADGMSMTGRAFPD